jgi:8-oxo-dGTP pyrophosphatase MutT (NUDIX family)
MTTLDPSLVEVRPAATVMLVRDGAAGIEVFMLRRNPLSEFVGGAFVFPGGAVDDHDQHPGVSAHCAGLADDDASAALGLDTGGLAFWVAAIRECFEECGLLLAYRTDGSVVRFDDPEVEARFATHRSRVDAGELSMTQLCSAEELALACDSIHYFSHWITPVGPSRRYDTRFFVARAPEAQVGLHDDRETVASLWVRPTEALERAESGELEIIFPTARNLEALTRFATADAVLDAARPDPSSRALVHEPGGTRIALPGDPGHGALPGDPGHGALPGDPGHGALPGDPGYQGAAL